MRGVLRRAPLWMRNLGLEWFHRLLSEPRRLWRRYLVTNTVFLLRAICQLTLRRRPTASFPANKSFIVCASGATVTEKPESSGSRTGAESSRPEGAALVDTSTAKTWARFPRATCLPGGASDHRRRLGGWLWRCPGCDSLFRHPVPAEEDYLSLYESVHCGVWQAGALRKDQKLVHAAVTRYIGGGRILDVGCFTGQLLCGFDASYEKFGVEPAVTAAESAKNKAIHVLGSHAGRCAGRNAMYLVRST